MKNYFLLFLSTLCLSCSAPKVLKTDTSKDIDLSGRWNDTDAEIAASELFNNLITSSWQKDHLAANKLTPKVAIEEFEANFKGGSQSVQRFFKQYAESSDLIQLLEDSEKVKADYTLSGEIRAEEYITETQDYIDYIFSARLFNKEGRKVWEDVNTIKKYLKE